MNINFLDFEQPIAELEAKINELRLVGNESGVEIGDEIERLQKKSHEMMVKIFGNLTDWQKVQLARHPHRPYTLDYIERIFTDFTELHGDRIGADDKAIVGGLAKLNGMPVMVIGQQKGRGTKEKVKRNFGMASPEGYRKSMRLLKMAEKFKLPVFTFIDTAGAYPGIKAEENGQSEAIAASLSLMSDLDTPIIATVIGEGGSGGALAIGVADRLLMLEFSVYSVISPEGCASILWKTAEKASTAAEAMNLTAEKLYDLGLVDFIIKEPLGGAHRNFDEIATNLKKALVENLAEIKNLYPVDLTKKRYERLISFGRFED